MERKNRSTLWMAGAGATVVALDQTIKTAVRASLAPCVRPPLRACDQIPLIGHAVEVIRAQNAGSALGAAQGLWAWTLLGGLGVALAISLRRHSGGRPALAVAIGLLVGGAVANLLDRLIFGHVTDFLSFAWSVNRGLAINVADLALLVGTAFATLGLYRGLYGSERTSAERRSIAGV